MLHGVLRSLKPDSRKICMVEDWQRMGQVSGMQHNTAFKGQCLRGSFS